MSWNDVMLRKGQFLELIDMRYAFIVQGSHACFNTYFYQMANAFKGSFHWN